MGTPSGKRSDFLFVSHQRKHQAQHRRYRQRGQEDVRVRYEGGGPVVAHDGLGVGQHRLADPGTHHAWDENLGEDAHALEHPRLAHGGQLADLGAEHRHARQVAAHHQQGTDEHEGGGLEEEQEDVARHEPREAEPRGEGKALFVVDLAPQGGDHRGQHDGGGHDEHIVSHAQGHLVVKNEIGHKDLNGDIEQDEGDQIEIQGRVCFDRRRQETVDDGLEIALLGRLKGRFFDHEATHDAHENDHAADDGKDVGPTGLQVEVKEHEAAEDGEDGHQGHHGVDTLGTASVGVVGAVGEPGVEGGVVGGRAEEGHDTVKDNDQRHAHGCRGSHHGENRLDPALFQKNKAKDGHAPEDIAARDEHLALAQLVGERAHKNCREGCGDGAGGHHGGDVGGGGVEHFVDEHVEVHVFHYPSNLTDQAEDGQGDPETGRELCFHSRVLS